MAASTAARGWRRLRAPLERGLDFVRVETQPGFGSATETDRSEFALMVIDVAPRDPKLLGYRGGVDQPAGRRAGRVDDGVQDRADDTVADQVGDASRELVDDFRCEIVELQGGL